MIAEIREKHAIDLDPSPAFERGLGGQDRPRQSIDFAIIGSSHASKVSAALERQGFSCELVFTSNWRVSPSSVEDMRIRLKEVVREKDPTTIVFHMLDNSAYYGRAEDGSCYAPRRGDDGIYHVEGEVYVCGRDTLLQHFNTIKPLLDLSNKRRGILISPMPRYTQAGCCSEPDHCSNRRFQDFEQQQQQNLDMAKKHLKDYLYYDGYRNIRVLDPCIDLRAVDPADAWDEDPIHPTSIVYSRIAAAVAKVNDRMRATEADMKRRRDSMGESGPSAPDARRGRLDSHQGSSVNARGRGAGGRRPYGGGRRGNALRY
jgi:hypothetical protein